MIFNVPLAVLIDVQFCSHFLPNTDDDYRYGSSCVREGDILTFTLDLIQFTLHISLNGEPLQFMEQADMADKTQPSSKRARPKATVPGLAFGPAGSGAAVELSRKDCIGMGINRHGVHSDNVRQTPIIFPAVSLCSPFQALSVRAAGGARTVCFPWYLNSE